MDHQESKGDDDKPRMGGVSDLSVIEESEQLKSNGDSFNGQLREKHQRSDEQSSDHPARSLSPDQYADVDGIGRRTRSLSAVQIQGNSLNNINDEYPNKMPRRSSLASGNRSRMQKHVSFSSSSDEKAIASGMPFIHSLSTLSMIAIFVF
ncbi:hypothetical protein TrispH2_009396 [Trichoplax sp. H2]|nr:hypothetical protein TrispH2_009396 [Trichoplax sp. H2]|eukprot:RDD39764.1 hypothetical protein TrispH2_009396 [Trichoplax sp. H2]